MGLQGGHVGLQAALLGCSLASTEACHSSSRPLVSPPLRHPHFHGMRVISGAASSDSRTLSSSSSARSSYVVEFSLSSSLSARSRGSLASRWHSSDAIRAARSGDSALDHSATASSCWPASTAHIIRSVNVGAMTSSTSLSWTD